MMSPLDRKSEFLSSRSSLRHSSPSAIASGPAGSFQMSLLILAFSVWLNTIYEGHTIPWFGGQLAAGNSLIVKPPEQAPLPVFKVLYRNTNRMQETGGSEHEVLHPLPTATSTTAHAGLTDRCCTPARCTNRASPASPSAAP